MDIDFLYRFLKEHKQEHVITILDHMPLEKKRGLFKQIQEIASRSYQPMSTDVVLKNISLPKEVRFSGTREKVQRGLDTLLENQTGCLIFAGGQATRLNTNIPKGLFSIRGKSLFEQICFWILAYSEAFHLSIPVIVLTSKQNKEEIQRHFQEHNFFGLSFENILFLQQEEHPCFNEEKQWILLKDRILQAANGNGGVFEALQREETKFFVKKHRLKYLHLVPIDNPLDDPLDINLLGDLRSRESDAVIKVFLSKNPKEKVGRIYQEHKKHLIVDYMELSEDEKKELIYANGGHYCIKLSSLFELEKKEISLPYHFVRKKMNSNLFVWKAEQFVFDLFSYLPRVSSLCYERKQFFAPLKEKKDQAGIEDLLKQKDEKICQVLKKQDRNLSYKDLAQYLKMKFKV